MARPSATRGAARGHRMAGCLNSPRAEIIACEGATLTTEGSSANAGRRAVRSAEQYWEDIARRAARWGDLNLGPIHAWEIWVTQDAINGYADGVEDRNPWYGPFPTEIGSPIAPPLLLSHACKDVIKPLGTSA